MSDKRKILWISPLIPYDTVTHAGGKVHNYYIKYFKRKFHYSIELITFAQKEELEKIDLDKYGINYKYIVSDLDWVVKLIYKIINLESTYNPFQRYGGGISNFNIWGFKKLVRDYIKSNKEQKPDFIIMQWTQAGLMINFLRKYYPDSKYIIIEEDVSFQGTMRRVDFTLNPIFKVIRKKRACKYKLAELEALKQADIVTVNNFKDRELLIRENIEENKIVQVVPYFDNRLTLKTTKRNKNILFYGAMDRKENYLSAIWFIKNVFFHLEDQEMKFLIIGGKPYKELFQYESEKIKVVGFVEDVGLYFKNSLCLVAPLVLGAGIKIKVLEALSAGLPVLTNEIGAEGIGMTRGEHYLHCTTASDYISAIQQLKNNVDLQDKLSNDSRQFIKYNFNIDRSLDFLHDRMTECTEQRHGK